jgi:hypothetical protein
VGTAAGGGPREQLSPIRQNPEPVPGKVSIPQRFNGPLDGGHGGYCARIFAALIDEPAAVNLRRPVPLEQPLDTVAASYGSIHIRHGEELIAEVLPAPPPALVVPEPVDLAAARAASERYRGASEGPFGDCFVCGRAREDSLGVFAGQVGERAVVASPWKPPAWGAAEDGTVAPELVWSVLDCPAVFAAFLGSDDDPVAYLVRFRVEIRRPVVAAAEHVVIGWPIAREGRKHRAGCALLSAEGELLALADALMIEPRA